MIRDGKQTKKNDALILAAVKYLEKKGFENISADVEGYPRPAVLSRQGHDSSFVPNILVTTTRGKHYYEVVPEGIQDETLLASKWTLLSSLASMRDGDFHLFVPYGKLRYTQDFMNRYQIQAEIIKLGRVRKTPS
jgi:hypothetical protein